VKAAAPGKSAAVKPAEKQAAQPVVPKNSKKAAGGHTILGTGCCVHKQKNRRRRKGNARQQ